MLAVDEDYESYGLTSEAISIASELGFKDLKTAPRRIAYPDIPVPYSRNMESFSLPSSEKIIKTVKEMIM